MQKGQYFEAILRSPKTVFTLRDIVLLWGETSAGSVRVRLNQYVRRGKLCRLRKGFYVKDKNYNKLEFAARLYPPAYVSFETILARAGLIFQFHAQISIASYLTREVEVDGQVYSFRKIKMPILTNPIGVVNENETSFATTERAFLDTFYIHGDYHFDNLSGLDWNKVLDMLPIYQNQSMEKRVRRLYKQVTQNG